jgi:hypothetical protein
MCSAREREPKNSKSQIPNHKERYKTQTANTQPRPRNRRREFAFWCLSISLEFVICDLEFIRCLSVSLEFVICDLELIPMELPHTTPSGFQAAY